VSELHTRRCVPCEGGVTPLARAAAEEVLQRLDENWQLSLDATSIQREYRLKDFFRTMSFVNAVAHVANLEDHHPDLEIGYGYCRVRFTTHAIQGLSENDFICAAKIDQLPV
jgi:4a-hydroxytetrahydrobiopterin dehydratase